MADQMAEMDAYMEYIDQVADELERQVAPCPTTRPMLIAWLTERVRNPDSAREIQCELPSLPQALESAYIEWMHLGGGQ
ncbi:hypothetical protein F3J44_21275 [Pantoea sp. Tr-811]|nr:hypothetical protein [Pantoea sp. Tr-811]